ncbi:MAG: hypothetical protein M1815_003718 [Lichina confinis]|nr:MAG: hypothetical protein M1815_003718 [Lichina confinis]
MPILDQTTFTGTEQEPLLGRPGDATQTEGKPLYHNLVIGTAVVAQAGIWILIVVIWVNVLSLPPMLLAGHPLLNSFGLLLITQSVLLLQPTHTQAQKRKGTQIHSILNSVGVLALLAGLIVIEVNKQRGGTAHMHSPHAWLGLLTYIVFFVQALVGLTQYYTPKAYGGVDKAKKIYKYHRMSGYVVLVLALATIAAATQTDFNKNVGHIMMWTVILPSLLILAGIVPRIKKQKLGLN